jgi:hypothetical protein
VQSAVVRGLREIRNSIGNRVAGDRFSTEIAPGCVNEARQNHAAKIQHERIRDRHDRHVARRAAGGAKEANDLVFPGIARQFH